MDTMFENLDFRFDKENNDERPFMIACKDREIMDGERWVLVSLSTDEAKRLYGCNTHKSNKNRIVPEKICLHTKKKPETAMRPPAFCV